ncbi:hypothetical protein GLYMA_14G216466v4 [Glycine max]|nr:hypothetical protein GLYMA_14G216466v4 [Glycine max]KAH1095664.1 hypothetical protein GYH30_040788 [Glycine max]
MHCIALLLLFYFLYQHIHKGRLSIYWHLCKTRLVSYP